jgi:hypothetical protein
MPARSAHLPFKGRPLFRSAPAAASANAIFRQLMPIADIKTELYLHLRNWIMNGEVLNSWKEIAEYMGRGVRTVQRWEQELGLPVRRPRGKSRSAVIALKADLDRWLHNTPQGATARESSQRIDYLQLHRNTELLKRRAAEVMAHSQKLQARIAESMALAAALKAKQPALAKPIPTLSVPPPRGIGPM